MKPSRYNVMSAREDGGAVLYNTLYGSLTSLEPTDLAGVTLAMSDPSTAPPSVVSTLLEQKHLVGDDSDELAIVASRRRAGIQDRHRLDVIVMTTMDCNLACTYCYEDREPGSRMSGQTEARLLAWLEREIPSATLLMLQWFGGEPLLDTPLISRVSRRAREVASASGTDVSLHITTNGYLLDGWRRRELLDAGVRDFQVTVDGPAATHDVMRPTRSGRASFDRIFANVGQTVREDPGVGMTLRVNVNHTNVDRIGELLNEFEPDVRARLRLALEPIFGADSVSATGNIDGPTLSAALAALYDHAASLGYQVAAVNSGLLTGRLTYCYAERERQYVINHDGSVFKCTTGSFAAGDRLGVLTDAGEVRSEGDAWDRWMDHGRGFASHCQECVYLPICMGGCRKQTASGFQTCTLVPSNASYVLKQIALSGYPEALTAPRILAGPQPRQPEEVR